MDLNSKSYMFLSTSHNFIVDIIAPLILNSKPFSWINLDASFNYSNVAIHF